MKRTFGALALGALLLTLGACSKTDNASTTTTAAPTTAASGGSTTAKTNDTKATSGSTKTPVTKPTKVEKVEKSKLPTKAQSADQVSGLSSDQQECVDYVIYTTVTENPSLADSELALAGVVGGSLVACVPQEALATGITAGIKSSAGGANLTSTQESCIQQALATANPDGLAVVIGAAVINEPSILAQAATELDAACGTKLGT